MGSTAIMLMLVTIISKVMGFAREMVMGNFFGTSDIASIYVMSNTLPVVIVNFVANGIIAGFIPVYNMAKKEGGIERAEKFTSNLFNILMVFGTIAIFLGMVFARVFCKILSPSLDGELLDIATTFTRIMMFSVYAYLYSAVYRGYLNQKGDFITPATTGIVMDVIIIFFIVLSGIRGDIYLLAIGALLGNSLQYALFPIALKKKGYKHKFKIDLKDEYTRALLRIVIPTVISVAAAEIALIVDNSMASAFFGNDKISVLDYSKKIIGIIYGIITVSITTSIYPTIARLASEKNFSQMKKELNSTVILTLAFVVPSVIGLMSLSNPIISLVYKRGAFNEESVAITAGVLFSYAPYVIFQSISDVIDRSFYAVGDSKTPVAISISQQVFNIIGNLVLINFFGLNGIAVATSLSCLYGAIILMYFYRKKFGKGKALNSIISVIKITIISIIMGLIAHFSYNLFNKTFSEIISTFFAIAIAGIFYVLAILISQIPEIKEIVNKVYHKVFKNK
ncbi:MAG: murein biosynthesis integral membrane protein MurJ [Peptoniphilaceae bacterium]|nr:murein biosynthesis integral membrane protein MurJ [Peptoniphilaceae bacterium]MDD7383932.1 murein biosynthesis integral membrane protein MurJ [Peptoniphilaceae bacterium]MDY3738075.1 murein biosynthesis integral membrane protein MurJ [Peptoniphilaceae bacterium]